MKLLLENWRTHLNEISFDKAKKRLETKALTKWIKGMAFDEETKTMTLNPNQIEAAKNALAKLVLEFVPEDLTDGKPDANGNPTKPEKGLTLEWLISVGINDPLMKQKFYNEAIADSETDSGRTNLTLLRSRGVALARVDLRAIRSDLERYWRANEYSDRKDIFSIKSFADLAVAADRAKRKYDNAMQDKEFQDPEKGTEVFDHPDKNKWFIAALHTKAAACHYGKRTDWCTATDTDMFDQYYEPDDPLFYFEDRQVFDRTSLSKPAKAGRDLSREKRQDGRFQFHFGSDSFMDNNDAQVDDETRDYFIDLLSRVGAAKTLPEFVPGPLAAPVEKYQILQYWVTKNEVAQTIYDENTTPEELMAIAKKYAGEGEEEIIEMIIDSGKATKEILEYLVLNDEDYGQNALSDPRITDEWINRLAYSEDATLRYLASYAYDFNRNEAVSDEALDKLSEDPAYHIRIRIAMHPFAPPETLAKMANRLMKGEEKERIEAMLSNLLSNDSLPSNIITTLVDWSKTQKNVEGGPGLAGTLAFSAMNHATRNSNASAEILREIGNTILGSGYSAEGTVAYSLASNENTPEDILLKLTKNKTEYVRKQAKEQLANQTRGVKLESLRESFKKFMK